MTKGNAKRQEDLSGGSQFFRIVGIGASAGGLAALQGFFDMLPSDTGMAFVVVTHMDPERESLLPELLQSHTAMIVHQVQSNIPIEPNSIYVISPNRRIIVTDHHLDIEEFEEPRGRRTPIDHFFRSLAKVHRDAVAIILSGGGTDGAVGVKDIKEQGGLLLVQHPHEAEHDSMPRAAIATGLADIVLPVRELAEKLVAYQRNGSALAVGPDTLTERDLDFVQRILAQVQARTGHDFSQYKHSTLLRRIERRLHLAEYTSLEAYLMYLRHTPDETRALFNDLLIGVTNFFRDQEAWQALTEQVIPHLFKDKGAGQSLRVWTIGCSTGEEAYTVAMLLLEYAAQLRDSADIENPFVDRPIELQVFASDLDDAALEKARDGLYPEAIEADVSPERLERFFTKEGHYYRVRRELRNIVLFTSHSVLRDPPFSRVDLISCRNLLIYLNRDLQENVLDIFHYALNAEGYLFLGSAESANRVDNLFRTLDKTHRLYQARAWRGEYPHVPTLPLTVRTPLPGAMQDMMAYPSRRVPASRQSTATLHQAALETYGPPSILVDEQNRILHVSETAGRYLLIRRGSLSNDLLELVRPELQFELRAALLQAFRLNKAIVTPTISVQFNGTPHHVVLSVRPQQIREDDEITSQEAGSTGKESEVDHAAAEKEESPTAEWLALVVFLEHEGTEAESQFEFPAELKAETYQAGNDQAQVKQLQAEVRHLRERARVNAEEYESSNEELKAANEELQSINEEYRSTAEELETSKEELQSLNEELQTVNTELKNKLEEIRRINSDLENLMAATQIATLFLDRELRIRHFTPAMEPLFNVLPGDRGRPIGHLTNQLDYAALTEDAAQVLRTLVPIEREIYSQPNKWFLVRLRPYRTIDDRIDGIVLTFVDVTALKQVEAELWNAKEYSEKIVDTVREGLLVLEPNLNVQFANDSFLRMFQISEADTIGKLIYELGDGRWNVPNLRQLLEEILPKENALDDFRVEFNAEEVDYRIMLLNARKLSDVDLILLAIEDVTEREQAIVALRASEAALAQEVLALGQLHQMTEQVVIATNLQQALDIILSTAVKLGQADFGNIQLLNTDRQILAIVAQTGFDQAFLQAFSEVSTDDSTTCGQALRQGRRVFIEDVTADADYDQYVDAVAAAGYRAVQSTPLVNHEHEIVGILSTHYRQPTKLSERDKQYLDLLAYQAANLLERLRMEAELEGRVQERTSQVQALAFQLTIAEHEERGRIAQLLHDNLQQELFGIKLHLDLLHDDIDQALVQQKLEELATQMDEAILSTRHLSADLSPPVLHSEDITEVFQWLADRIKQRYGLQVELEAAGTFPVADKGKRVLLFQVLRELLFNVVKHAEVSQVTVRLQHVDAGYHIHLVDRGVGFDVQQVLAGTATFQGRGLMNARERLRLIGGHLEIESTPGAGTQLLIYVPIDAQRPAPVEA